MRAEMTLATGVVPVALGITMALMSGMARAEDKAAQTPSNAVSAQTTIPSVGHRPDAFNGEITTMVQHEVSGRISWAHYNILITPMVGQGLILRHMGKYNPDKDNQFGASERSIEHKGPGVVSSISHAIFIVMTS